MPDIVNDGGVVGASRLLTISAVTYSTDDFRFDTPTGTQWDRTNHKSVLTGANYVKGKITGSATLQLATSATALPAWGATFTETEGTFIITSVGRTETKNGETKVPISFAKAITGSVTTE